MPSTQLIDAIVRQTTVLIASLATAQGQRAPLAGVANQVFSDLVGELKRQGLGNKVIADMFGLALRTYHNQVTRYSESRTSAGQSVWTAVLSYLQERGTTLRSDVMQRFGRDDAAVVRGVLKDLVDSGIVFRTGSGDRTAYRVARPDELALEGADHEGVLANLVLAAVFQHGPLTADALRQLVPLEPDALQRTLDALVQDDRLERVEHQGAPCYRADAMLVSFHDSAGWEAALFDHYQAMVTAMCTKLRLGQTHAELQDATGGSTYTFNVWQGHPFEQEVVGLLSTLRQRSMELWDRLDRYNAEHARPTDARARRVVAYVGQSVRDEEDRDDV